MSKATAQRDNLAVIIQLDRAEAVRKEVVECGLLDTERKILVKDGLIEIPVKEAVPGQQVIIQDKPEFYRKTPELAELLGPELPHDLQSLLPRGWYILGDIIIVKIKSELDPFKYRIGQALLSIYPRCKSVLRDFGIVGQLRNPIREIIAGDSSETVHRENGVCFKLDARKIMFSQGNLKERIRMSGLGRDEVVVDMFAGIGYFSLPMAVHSKPKKVIAIELNPTAFGFLSENIRLNQVQDIVQPVLGDCSEKAPEGKADRVIMGFVGTTDLYLKKGLRALKPGGVLHYHQTIPSWLYPAAAIEEITKASNQLGLHAEVQRCIKVKKYAPGVVHAVIDCRIDADR